MKRNFRLVIFGAALWPFCGMGGSAAAKTTVSRFIQDFDLNSDQMVSAEEFIGPETLFAELDLNQNGYIEADEAPQGPPPGPPPQLDPEKLLAACDLNGDGTLSESETVAALEANRPQGPSAGGMGGGPGGMQGPGGMGRPGGPPPDTGGYNYETESGLAGYLKVAGINSDQISSILAMLGMNSESYRSGSLFSLNS